MVVHQRGPDDREGEAGKREPAQRHERQDKDRGKLGPAPRRLNHLARVETAEPEERGLGHDERGNERNNPDEERPPGEVAELAEPGVGLGEDGAVAVERTDRLREERVGAERTRSLAQMLNALDAEALEKLDALPEVLNDLARAYATASAD